MKSYPYNSYTLGMLIRCGEIFGANFELKIVRGKETLLVWELWGVAHKDMQGWR